MASISKRKRIKRGILIFLILIILTSCVNHLNEGIIIEKHYTKAYNLYSPMIIIVNKRTQIIPRWIYHPDRWYIVVQKDNVKDIWDITEEYYNSIEIGDYVKIEETR